MAKPQSDSVRPGWPRSIGGCVLYVAILTAAKSGGTLGEACDEAARCFISARQRMAAGHPRDRTGRGDEIDAAIRLAEANGWKRGDNKRIALEYGVTPATITKRKKILERAVNR